ncbi:XRE family transcriptional regulator [Ferruginibacter sp.]
MLQIKQEGLAMELGDDWTQKKVSQLEGKEVIDDKLLEQIAAYLKVPVEAIKNFDEEAAVNIISGTFSDTAAASIHHHSTFNENANELVKLEELKKLYEGLLKEKDERIKLLERLVGGK